MKKLKKLNVVLFALLFILSNPLYGQVSFGVRGGLNFANVAVRGMNDEFFEVDGKTIGGFHLGGIIAYSGFADSSLVLQSGLLLTGKGSKVVEYDKIDKEVFDQEKYTLFYLSIPVNVLYHFDDRFFVGGGPFVGFAIGGNIIYEGVTTKMSIGNGQLDDWAPLDFGIGIQAGAKVKVVNVGAGFDLSLPSVFPSAWEDSGSMKNRVFYVFATYIFSKK